MVGESSMGEGQALKKAKYHILASRFLVATAIVDIAHRKEGV
jgi:hypothetical protein